MTISKNGAAIVLFILSYFGFDVSENDVVQFISGVGQVLSFIMLVWNQVDRKDVKMFLFKK